jgi:hypothetical protein
MILPASDELVLHAIALHRQRCPLSDWRARFCCPCHTTILLACRDCSTPLLLAPGPERRLCPHGRQLLAYTRACVLIREEAA